MALKDGDGFYGSMLSVDQNYETCKTHEINKTCQYLIEKI